MLEINVEIKLKIYRFFIPKAQQVIAVVQALVYQLLVFKVDQDKYKDKDNLHLAANLQILADKLVAVEVVNVRSNFVLQKTKDLFVQTVAET